MFVHYQSSLYIYIYILYVYIHRRAVLSISKTADLLGFSCTAISRVYREWSKKEKISNERQLCGHKCLVEVRGEWADWLEMIERQQ